MSRLQVLVKGEFERLNKYNLFTANFVAMLIWVVIAWFFEGEELRTFIPFIFVMDSTMMTILLVGATLFYEKKEHTINSIMISPVTEGEYLISKVIVNVLNSLFTVVFISAALYFMKDVTFNYLVLVPAVIIVTVVHTMIGIKIAYHAKDFTSMLVYFMVYSFAFLFPSILAMLGVIKGNLVKYLIVLPPEASSIIINASVKDVEITRLLFGYLYLFGMAYVLYKYFIKTKFNEYVMRETGV
jgi:fluoroquinolone transport system permease protein